MRNLTCIMTVAVLICGGVASASNIFFSTVESVGGGVSVGNPDLVFDVADIGSTQRLSIWVTDELLVDRGLAVDMAVSSGTEVVDLVGAAALNFDLQITNNGTPLGDSGSDRWQSTGSLNPVLGVDLLKDLNANTATDNGGIRAANSGPASGLGTLDPGYDTAAGAFLYGWLDVELTGEGMATVALQQSGLGIAQGGTDIAGQFDYGTATITVVPEPASLALLGLGGLALIRRRR